MAEIRIQEKKKQVWPWILLIIIVVAAAVLLYMYFNNHKNDKINGTALADSTGYYQEDTVTRNNSEVPGDNVEQLQQYVQADSSGVFNREYVSNGINLLTGAVHEILNKGDSTRNKISTREDSLSSYTRNLTDTLSNNFSRETGKAFSAVFDIISSVQQSQYPDLKKEAEQLQAALQAFDNRRPVEAQQKPVRDFFRMSASILSNMKNTARAI